RRASRHPRAPRGWVGEPPARLLPRPLAQEEAPQEAVLHAGDGTPPREGARPGRPPAPFDRRARVPRGDPRDAAQSLRSAGARALPMALAEWPALMRAGVLERQDRALPVEDRHALLVHLHDLAGAGRDLVGPAAPRSFRHHASPLEPASADQELLDVRIAVDA